MRYRSGVLLAGGLEPGDQSTDQVLELSFQGGVTGRLGALAEPVHDSAGAVVAGRPTLVGGGGATELPDVQRRGATGRWRVVGQLPGPRSDLSVAPAGRGLLVLGGYDGARSPTAVLRSRDGSRFRVISHLPAGVRYAGVARSGRTVWLLGGEVDHRELTEVLSIDTRTGAVARAGRMPHPLGHEAVVVVGDRLLVMGGRTGPDTVTDRMWWFDTRSGAWSHAGRLPFPLADAPWVQAGKRALLFGGETPAFTAKVTQVTWD